MILTPAPIAPNRRKQVAAASTLLKGPRGTKTFDDFIFKYADSTKEYRQIEAVHKPLRQALRGHLLRQDIHIGAEILEPLLFRLIRDGSVDPVSEAVAELNQQAFHEPGFVLYPVHSYGVMRTFSLASPGPAGTGDLVFTDLGIAIAPPTQSIKNTLAFVTRSAAALGITSPAPISEIRQEHANPRLHWLSKNPLLMIRVRSYSAGAYENQSEFMRRLGLGAAFVMLLSVLVDPRDEKRWNSSRSSNETLDIRHYLVGDNGGGGRNLSHRRVPMNLSPAGLAQLSDLNVNLHLDRLAAPAGTRLARRAEQAIVALEAFTRLNAVIQQPATARTRLSSKLLDSVYWFRRSFPAGSQDHEAIVSLAVAFESLLIDSYASGVTGRIVDRAIHILKAEGQPAPVQEIVRKLFSARGDIVHAGSTSTTLNLPLAREAYAFCLLHLLGRIGHVSETTTTAVGDMLGEVALVRAGLGERVRRAWRALMQG
ncbi:hypothetical protein [Brevundimonas sp. R86498]|uniref:hypothetical protein n=1 Tax=Brevundimonas sp. R86498 TaxID=3093845 RepID=UPI0037CA160E